VILNNLYSFFAMYCANDKNQCMKFALKTFKKK
jgi:hypothetical protein